MMATSEEGIPQALKERVFADLRPVRPLAPPWQRALVLAPLGLVLVFLVHFRWGTRADLGMVLLWGLSLLQFLVGVALVAAALREVIPGRGLSAAAALGALAGGSGLALAVTFLAWRASPTVAPEALRYPYWKTCLSSTIELGLPVLIAILVLASRGALWRPRLVGAIGGAAAGLMADAAWRTFCNVSEPAHVLSAHLAGIAVLAVLGSVLASLWAALGRSR